MMYKGVVFEKSIYIGGSLSVMQTHEFFVILINYHISSKFMFTLELILISVDITDLALFYHLDNGDHLS